VGPGPVIGTGLLEISDIRRGEAPPHLVRGFALDAPIQGPQHEQYALTLRGWLLGAHSPVAAVEVWHGVTLVRSSPVSGPRPDVAVHFPDLPHAQSCGFDFGVGLLGVPPSFELQVHAVLHDGARVPVGTVRGRRAPLVASFRPRLQPIAVTSLWRTGTTWLLHLLAQHPGIVAHAAYPYETRFANYWMHALKVLADPANTHQSSGSHDFQANMFSIGHNPYYEGSLARQPVLQEWWGKLAVERLAAFCQQNVEELYLRVARIRGQERPTHFVEKFHPIHIPWIIRELYAGSREIFLVRDLRDVLCSVIAFNAKRGFDGFGRDDAGDDRAYLRLLAASTEQLLQDWKARPDRSILVRYEDLVSRPVDTLRTVLAHVGVDAREQVIEEMLDRAAADTAELQYHRTSEGQMASIGRWRRELPPELRVASQDILSDVLRELRYATDVDGRVRTW
jgi:hypothetical protein